MSDTQLAEGFLDALEELTRHVPEQAENLLLALRSDLREYRMLKTHIASSENEVLLHQSVGRIAAIQKAVKTLVVELTQEALETLRAEEASEADRVLGKEKEPRLVRATEDFRHFLAGMREAREITAPPAVEGEEDAELIPLPSSRRKRSSQ